MTFGHEAFLIFLSHTNTLAQEMAAMAKYCILTTTGWIMLGFSTNLHGPQSIGPNDLGYPLTLHPA